MEKDKRYNQFLKFVEGKSIKELDDNGILGAISEFFNPFHSVITDDFVEALINSGDSDSSSLPINEFYVDGGNRILKINPNEMPPRGIIGCEDWDGVLDLRKKLIGK